MLLTHTLIRVQELCESGGGRPGLSGHRATLQQQKKVKKARNVKSEFDFFFFSRLDSTFVSDWALNIGNDNNQYSSAHFVKWAKGSYIQHSSIFNNKIKTLSLSELNSLHRRAGKWILPDPSLSTEQKMRALRILNLPQQLAYNKGIFMHKVLNNNSPNYLAQLFISHQSHYTNSRNNLYVPRPRLDLFKAITSFSGASLWNSLPQNIKSCISFPCFKRNLHKYVSENNLSSGLDGFYLSHTFA